MKNIFIVILVVFSMQQSQAQIEVSTNPVALLFTAFPISASVPINRNISAGLDILLIPEVAGIVYIKGRYYLTPKFGADRFHLGLFAGAANESIGIGFLAGYKILSSKGIFFDAALGVGRGFGEGESNILPYAQLHFGYRFGKKTLDDKIKK